MEAPTFEESVRERAGLLDGPRFRVALRTAVAGLASQLDDARAALGLALPPELLSSLRQGDVAGPRVASLQELYLGVAVTARVRVGVAIQVVHAVVVEVADRMGAAGRVELRRALAPAWADLLAEPTPTNAARVPGVAARGPRASGQAE